MPEHRFIARLFLIVGATLALAGLALWLALPIRPMFPPYLATALAALAYGVFCRRRPSLPEAPKP